MYNSTFRRNVSLGSTRFTPKNLHPVKDASTTGCKRDATSFSTERIIPNRMINKYELKIANYETNS